MDEVLQKWHEIISDLDGCSQIIVPRLYGNLVGAKCVELHGFSDALLRAYGCGVYIKIYCHDNSFVTSLVIS